MLASFLISSALAIVSCALPQGPLKVITSCTTANTVALTFDDGPYIYLKDIVDRLDAAGVKGTFFMNGNNWDCIWNMEADVQYAYNKGHQIASHTWNHPDLTTLPYDQIQNEMTNITEALQDITGCKPAFFRPPYGSYNDDVLKVASQLHQTVVTWDFDSGDSTGSTVAQSESTYDQALASHPNNILALNHETYQNTTDQVLPYALNKLLSAGYKLVTVAECLGGMPPCVSKGSPKKSHGSC